MKHLQQHKQNNNDDSGSSNSNNAAPVAVANDGDSVWLEEPAPMPAPAQSSAASVNETENAHNNNNNSNNNSVCNNTNAAAANNCNRHNGNEDETENEVIAPASIDEAPLKEVAAAVAAAPTAAMPLMVVPAATAAQQIASDDAAASALQQDVSSPQDNGKQPQQQQQEEAFISNQETETVAMVDDLMNALTPPPTTTPTTPIQQFDEHEEASAETEEQPPTADGTASSQAPLATTTTNTTSTTSTTSATASTATNQSLVAPPLEFRIPAPPYGMGSLKITRRNKNAGTTSMNGGRGGRSLVNATEAIGGGMTSDGGSGHSVACCGLANGASTTNVACCSASIANMKTSLSMTSLPPDKHQQGREVIKDKLKIERPYNSLKKNADRCHSIVNGNFGGSTSITNKQLHRYSWGSGYSQSSSSFHEDFISLSFQTNYNYIMDTNLLDTCKEARCEIECVGNVLENTSDGCCFKMLDGAHQRESSFEDPQKLRKWLREMEQKLETAPSVSQATLFSIADLQRHLAEHSVLYHEIVSHARVVNACIRAASERQKQQQQQHYDDLPLNTTKSDDEEDVSLSNNNTENDNNDSSSLSFSEEAAATSASGPESGTRTPSSSGIEISTASPVTPTARGESGRGKRQDRATTQPAAESSDSSSAAASPSGKRQSAGASSEGNLERLQNRYHLLYLKAFEVQLWLDGLLRKKSSSVSSDYDDDEDDVDVDLDLDDDVDDDDDDEEDDEIDCVDAGDYDLNATASDLESDVVTNNSSSLSYSGLKRRCVNTATDTATDNDTASGGIVTKLHTHLQQQQHSNRSPSNGETAAAATKEEIFCTTATSTSVTTSSGSSQKQHPSPQTNRRDCIRNKVDSDDYESELEFEADDEDELDFAAAYSHRGSGRRSVGGAAVASYAALASGTSGAAKKRLSVTATTLTDFEADSESSDWEGQAAAQRRRLHQQQQQQLQQLQQQQSIQHLHLPQQQLLQYCRIVNGDLAEPYNEAVQVEGEDDDGEEVEVESASERGNAATCPNNGGNGAATEMMQSHTTLHNSAIGISTTITTTTNNTNDSIDTDTNATTHTLNASETIGSTNNHNEAHAKICEMTTMSSSMQTVSSSTSSVSSAPQSPSPPQSSPLTEVQPSLHHPAHMHTICAQKTQVASGGPGGFVTTSNLTNGNGGAGKQKNIAIISPTQHATANGGSPKTPPTVLRKRHVDISKFNRSNRKSKNCAIFYFRHLDTDNETNSNYGALSSSASHTSDLLKSADATSDDDDDDEDENGGWLYSSAAGANPAAGNGSGKQHKSTGCLNASIGIQSSDVSSSTAATATTTTTTTKPANATDDSDKENKSAATAGLAAVSSGSGNSNTSSSTQITIAEIQQLQQASISGSSSAAAAAAFGSGGGSASSGSEEGTKFAVVVGHCDSSSSSSNGVLTDATTTTQITKSPQTQRTEMEIQIGGSAASVGANGGGAVGGEATNKSQLYLHHHHRQHQHQHNANANNNNHKKANNATNNNNNKNNNNNNNINNNNNNHDDNENNNHHEMEMKTMQQAQLQQQQQQHKSNSSSDQANGNAQKEKSYFHTRADICNITGKPEDTNKRLPPRSPAKSATKPYKTSATMTTTTALESVSTLSLSAAAKGKVSHESIKQLVLEAEHLVRDEALKTPTHQPLSQHHHQQQHHHHHHHQHQYQQQHHQKKKHHSNKSLAKILSTVKKREVAMPGPIKQRVQEWLEHQPSHPLHHMPHQQAGIAIGSAAAAAAGERADDCEASGEASETDSIPQHGGSDSSEGFTDSIATCMQTSTNSFGASTERIVGSLSDAAANAAAAAAAALMTTSTTTTGTTASTTMLGEVGGGSAPNGIGGGAGSSNQSLNLKQAATVTVVKRRQPTARRKSERPWSVSCLSQLTTDSSQAVTATARQVAADVQAGLASHSISESALDSLSPSRRPRASSTTAATSHAHAAAKTAYDSKGSLKRRRTRKKKMSLSSSFAAPGLMAAYSSGGKKTDSGSDGDIVMMPNLSRSLMKSWESMSAQQIQEITAALLGLQKAGGSGSLSAGSSAASSDQLALVVQQSASASSSQNQLQQHQMQQQQQQHQSNQHQQQHHYQQHHQLLQQQLQQKQKSPSSQLNDSDEATAANQLMKPNFRVGSYTTAYMRSETRLGSLAALANYMNDEDPQGEYTTGTDDHHSSFSETAWDDYQEKYNSENYSEGFDSDAARRLMEFGDDYRNFIDSQSDCCSSLSAANNLDSLSPPRMDSLQPNDSKVITHDSIVSSVDHARRRRALELEYERRRKTLEVRRKSCQDSAEVAVGGQLQQHAARSPTISLSSSANALTPKNPEKFIAGHGKADTATRKLDFGGMMMMSHSAQSLRRTSESDTSTRRRKVDERRRSSRNLEKCIKPIPATSSSSCDDSDDEKEMRNLLQQSRNRLEDTRALKIRCHLLRPEDYAEIINTCRDNIRCLESVLRGPPSTVLSTHCVSQTKDLLGAWEDLLRWSENAAAARKLQEEMIQLKHALLRLGNKTSFELLDTEPSIQLAIEALETDKSQLQQYRTNMLHLNASVHGWLTRQERKLQTALESEQQQQQVELSAAVVQTATTTTTTTTMTTTTKTMKPDETAHSGEESEQPQVEATTTTTSITVTDSNGDHVESLSSHPLQPPTTTAAVSNMKHCGTSTSTTTGGDKSSSWDLNSLMSSEQEFHKHLKDEVSDMYTAWDEADARINSQLEVLTTSLVAWRQLESGLFEFQQALGQDRGTLKGLEGALDKGQTTPVELAQNVKFMAKLLSEKVNVSQEQLTAVQEHLDPKHILQIAKFTASTGSLSDSGISDGGTTSDGGLSERERRLGVLRRLAKQLESALAPGSDAMKSIAARMESAEAELKNLQNTCRDLIVRTAATHQNKKQQQLEAQQRKDAADAAAAIAAATASAASLAGNGYLKANGHATKGANGSYNNNNKQRSPSASPSKRKNNNNKQRKQRKNGSATADDAVDATANGHAASQAAGHLVAEFSGAALRSGGAGGSGDPDEPPSDFTLDSSDEDGDAAAAAGDRPKRGWAWRIVRAAVPLQLALFTFLAAATLMQPNCCDNLNNLSMSFTPQLRYIRGPPPI